MKSHVIKLVVVSVCSACFISFSEPQGDGRPPVPGGMRENGRQGYGMGGRRADGFRMFMEKLKENDPATYERLEKLRVTDRNAYFAELRKLMPARPMVPSKVGLLELKCQKLSVQYHEARTEAEKEAIRKELEQAVEEATDAMIADMKERLKMMSERLAELEKNRQAAIEKRVDMLLKQKPDRMGPPGPPPPHPRPVDQPPEQPKAQPETGK